MTKYPASIDSQLELPTVINNSSQVNGSAINNVRDAVIAVETELGIKPSGIYGTVRARLNVIEELLNTLAGDIAVGGDLSGTNSNAHVIKLNGASVPAAGGLTAGHILKVATANTLAYGYIINANVADNAAIAGTKVVPNFGSQSLVTSGNVGLFGTPTYGGGTGVLSISNATINPFGNPSGGVVVYADATDGYLKYRTSNGDAITIGSGSTFTASGDLSGTNTNQTVIALRGNAVASETLGVVQDGYFLSWDNTNGYWKSAPGPSGSFTAGGDLSGTNVSQIVIKINGATVPAAGSLTTGHVLQVSGSSATTYGFVTNTNVSSSAAIAYSKLNLTSSIVNADINTSAAIAYSKLNLSNSIVNADISSSAAISYSKLNLVGNIVNADINASAAIAGTKISPDFGSQNVVTTGNAAFAGTPSYGSGSGVISLHNATTNPSTNPTNGVVLYVDVADGYVKYRKADGSVITVNSGGGGSFSAGGDLTGTSSNQQVVSVTGSGGVLNIATTAAELKWANNTSAPKIYQADNTTNSATAQDTTIHAQNATGTSSNGGNLLLKSGTGTSTDGYIDFDVGNTTLGTFNANKFITHKGRRISTTVTTTDLTIVDGYEVVIVDTLGAPITITMPASPTSGDTYTIKDQGGTSATNNITVSGNGNNIDGASSYVININYESITILFANGTWGII